MVMQSERIELISLRNKVYEANIELYNSGLVKYTFGNVSGINRELGIVAIKPSGVPYHKLTPEMITFVDLNGESVHLENNYNPLKPSSDTPTHLELYKAWPLIKGVAHSHSTYATALAQASIIIECHGTTHADYCRKQIPVTDMLTDEEIETDYEKNTGKKIIEEFEDSFDCMDTPMILVANHGPFTWGDSPLKSVEHMVMLEEIAKLAYISQKINSEMNEYFPSEKLIEKHFNRKHGKGAYYGQ